MRFIVTQKRADVVIVGGGPIGLAVALGYKKLNHQLNVVVLEKYEEFQRKHTLVMQYQHLDALMRATDSMDDPDLNELLTQLRKNTHIRTNVLQNTFKKTAKHLGVTIIHEKDDGLRYEVIDLGGALVTALIPWDQLSGFPRNAEAIIQSKENYFPKLLELTSKANHTHYRGKPNAKNPIKPFADALEFRNVPDNLRPLVHDYLYEYFLKLGKKVNPASVRISVNELPASRVKESFTRYQNTEKAMDVFVTANGDNALGLSYFKGLNAGLLATAKYFEFLRRAIINGLADKNQLEQAFIAYQTWFSPFAEQKINEVKEYSSKVRLGMATARKVEASKVVSAYKPLVDRKPTIDAYLQLAAIVNVEEDVVFEPYPHRPYNPDIQLGQFGYVSVQYHLKKIVKLFVDFLKPYKDRYQVMDDLKQPITGGINLVVGLGKIITAPFSGSFKRFLDGIVGSLRGIIEIVMAPLTYLLKLIPRAVFTLFSTSQKLEQSAGVKKLVTQGHQLLDTINVDEPLSFDTMKNLLGICNDLHRKFDKSIKRDQQTDIDLALEKESITKITLTLENALKTREKINFYFNLFKGEKSNTPLHSEQSEPGKLTNR